MNTILMVSNILLWVFLGIILVFIYLLTRIFVTHINNFNEDTVKKALNIDDKLPSFKAKDQRGGLISSDQIIGSVTKLIFLSDHCGSCYQVLDKLQHGTGRQNYLVLKPDRPKDSSLNINDKQYNFPLIRSTRLMNSFGIEKVPLIVSINQGGIITEIHELKDTEELTPILAG